MSKLIIIPALVLTMSANLATTQAPEVSGPTIIAATNLDTETEAVSAVAVQPEVEEVADNPDSIEGEVLGDSFDQTNQWWTQEEHELLAKVIMGEMGADIAPDEAQQGVAAVIINRVHHEGFADTISGVIYTKGQYACASYLHTLVPTERAKENALIALKGESGFPEDVVWQANFPQAAWGKQVDIYKIFFQGTRYETYFCRFGK